MMKKGQCAICHYAYDPDLGDQLNGVAPGTPFEAVPEEWTCPVCGAEKELF